MKAEAAVSFILVVLFLVSMFPLGTFSRAADSRSNSGSFNAQSIADPVDWSMFRFNPEHTGTTSENATPPLRLGWNTTLSCIYSSPAVVGGTVYVGSSGGGIYALNASTGAVVWGYFTPGGGLIGVASSPAVSGGVVYVGSENRNIYALNASTGVLIWNYRTGGMVGSSPAVSGGVVYVGSDDGYVYALDAATGTLRWSYLTGGYVESSPAVSGGVVYVGSWDGKVYALDAAVGSLKWKFTTGAYVYSSPAVSGGVVYVGSADKNVYALDAATGALKWSHTTGAPVDSSPAVSGGVVYVGSYDWNVYALNASTGASIWSYGIYYGFVHSSPAVSGGVVYVGSEDYNVYALDAATGGYILSYHTGGYVDSSPAVSGGFIYVDSYDGNVYAFRVLSPNPNVILNFPSASNIKSVRITEYTSANSPYPLLLGEIGSIYNITVETDPYTGNVTVGIHYDPGSLGSRDPSTLVIAQFDFLPGDINHDFNVNVLDAILQGIAFLSHGPNYDYVGEPASPNSNPDADINGDGVVNILDAIILSMNFGQTAKWIDRPSSVDVANSIVYCTTDHFSAIGIH